jgi:hypothetical protein
MENVSRAFVHGCEVSGPSPAGDWLQHQQCREVTLAANAVPTPPPRKPG